MARDFDGTNDNMDGGSDSSIDGFVTLSVAFWMVRDVLNATDLVIGKDGAAQGWWITVTNNANGNGLRLWRQWSTASGAWTTTGAVDTAMHHIAVVYDGGSTSNDPTMYVDGVAGSSETVAPTGTLSGDSGFSLRVGEAGDGGTDLDGALQNVCYANALWTAGGVNRHRWWGRVGGAVAVCHPLYTDKLVNEGSATANLTATGTTVISRIPRTVRPGCGGW